MVAVVLHHPERQGKTYRLATEKDMEVFREVEIYLEQKREELWDKWGFDPVPDEPLPVGGRDRFDTCRLPLYGMSTWGVLFNSRQKLALITFADKVRQAHELMLAEGYEKDYARAVGTYLAIIFDRLADKDANLVIYNVVGEKIEHVFGRQALPMVWDYAEVNPFTDVGWPNMQEWVVRIIEHCSQITPILTTVTQTSATSLPYPDNYFDAVITDPPYYDNVPYADLSDFFYVWIKRIIGNLWAELFATPLTPKSEEIVADAIRQNGKDKAQAFFEEKLTQSFGEIHRVLKPNGISVIVFAHKTTTAWETVINALLGAGLYLTASWPLHTEMKTRLRAVGTAGKERIKEVLQKSGPTLILMDELLQYIVRANQVEKVEKITQGQTLAFLQELSEAVATSEKAVLVLTLPASILEQYDEEAEKALAQLQKVSGRVESIYVPVEGIEIYEVIRKRLFENLGDPKVHRQIAEAYFRLYQELGSDAPAEVRETAYREKIERAYPFHPEFIDVLYERWGSFPTFQRTRGVLRLLALVVGDLYERKVSAPLIQSSLVDLAHVPVRREFIKHIGNEFETLIRSVKAFMSI